MLSLIPKAFAQGNVVTIQKPAGVRVTDIGDIISGAIGAAFILAGVLVFAYLVWGGIQWITAGGDKANVEAARTRISNALVGLAIVAASYAIVLIIQYVFGYTIVGQLDIPTFY